MKKRSPKKEKRQQEPEVPVDPYTGEVEPPAEGAYQVTEIVPKDPGNHHGENFLLEEEDSLDKYALDSNADAISEQMKSYTDDPDVKDEFSERQSLASGGRKKLEEKLREHHSMDPGLSAGDMDAAWDDSDASGEESVGGSVATPDQDIVDEIGKAAGLTYHDDEPLGVDEKLGKRDRKRWELNPASKDDEEDEEEEEK
jgi:hypothetical protein